MAYAGIQTFMEKLNHLIINWNDIPSINHPQIRRERRQLRLLYDELHNPDIQTLFIDQHQHLEKVNDLKKRFIDAAEEAQYIVDLFVSGVHIRNSEQIPTSEDFNRSRELFLSRVHFNHFLKKNDVGNNEHVPTSEDFNRSLGHDDVRRTLKVAVNMFLYEDFTRYLKLDNIMRSFECVKVELLSMTDSSQSRERTLSQSAAAPVFFTRNSQGSKKLMDEIVVGLDVDLKVIKDKLMEDTKKVDVVSIVGMGGIGKTTLATKVFNDPFVMYHFHVRVWVTVSQTYDKRNVLIQILESIRGQLHLQKDISESELRGMVHKNLIGKRYLIVIDDIWHTETWDNLKVLFFLDNNNNGSRILLTSRLMEVAKHANPDGLIHQLGYLSKEQSWDLLCQKVFSDNECPEWSIKPGMQIVENCHGLPLAVVVIAGVLAKEVLSEKFWVEIAKRTGSYIVGDDSGCMETLALSYSHLSLHLRDCFLYLGGFPEDYRFDTQRLIWLWMAEGFIQEVGNQSLEDIAEGYLMDLIDRNLVIIAERQECNGHVKTCKLHDIVRELCLKKAKEEQFILQTERLIFSSQSSNAIKPPYKPVRMFLNEARFAHLHSGKLRSLLCFGYFSLSNYDIANHFRSFVLLRVLDLQRCELNVFPESMELLVHLRYLAIGTSSKDFMSSICNLWNLQTLIYKSSFDKERIVLPSNISDLVNLRHLHFEVSIMSFLLPTIEKPMNLKTISVVELRDGLGKFQKGFPYIKKLACKIYGDKEYNFESLTCLEELAVFGSFGRINLITFPATLKTLTLTDCDLRWSDMSIIQSLPNLQVLKLHRVAFEGSCWNTNEHVFPQLKFLRLEGLDIKRWEAYSISFPCLKQLEILYCDHLEEIPFEIGEIPTLKLIKIKRCSPSLGDSVTRFQEELNYVGNNELKIDINVEGPYR